MTFFTVEEQQVLQLRAERLARSTEAVVRVHERFISFRRANQTYLLPAAGVLGVRPLPSFTTLPGCPPHVVGLVHLNGHTVGVLDLERLAEPRAPLPPTPWAVWVAEESKSALLVADEVLDLLDVDVERLAAPLRGAFGGRLASLVRAVLPGPLMVLEAHSLLDSELFRPLQR